MASSAIPACARAYLERDLSHSALAPVARWFAANLPPEWRGDPMVIAAAKGLS